MERPSDQSVQDMLSWVCPGRIPLVQWAEPQHQLEDNVKYELHVRFFDDDMDIEQFRAIVNNYSVHCLIGPRKPEGRVIFTLDNVFYMAHATTVRGRLECAEHDYDADGTGPAFAFNATMKPYKEGARSVLHSKEYFIEGRRHRSNGLPAVERQIVHNDTTPEALAEHMETNSTLQYWEGGHPRLGPRPFKIDHDLILVRDGGSGTVHSVIRNLDVSWNINWQKDEIPEHPLRFRAGKVTTVEVPINPHSLAGPWWYPHQTEGSTVKSRIFEDFELFWTVRPGRVATLTGKEIFDHLGINPTNIDWVGDKFFTDTNEDFAFLSYLMSEHTQWKNSQKS